MTMTTHRVLGPAAAPAVALAALLAWPAGTHAAALSGAVSANRVPYAVGASGLSSHERGKAYLGVEFHETTDEEVNALHLGKARGVEVAMVDHDGPAGKAGLQPHDILLQMDGKPIAGADDLRKRLREFAPGHLVSFSVLRVGQMLNLSAKLADREEVERDAWQQHVTEPPPSSEPPDGVVIESFTVETTPVPHAPVRGQSFVGSVLHMGPYTGMEVESMEPQLAQFFGAPANTGVLVHSIDASSPAASAGLHAGDVVLRVDGLPVATPSEFTRRIRSAGARSIALSILRDKHEQFLTLLPDYKRHSLLEWPKFF